MADTKAPRRRATYDDVRKAPAHMVAEIINGELYLSPRPAPRHARAESRLGVGLGPFLPGRGGPGGWETLNEPELHFGSDVLVPDLAGWRRERMPQLPDEAFFTLPPDWVCEVLSPSTEKLDRAKKLRVYARERVAHAWLVDPITRTLEVFTLTGSDWTLHATYSDHDRVRVVPFEAIALDLAFLWGETPATPEP